MQRWCSFASATNRSTIGMELQERRHLSELSVCHCERLCKSNEAAMNVTHASAQSKIQMIN
jgi:hypothetical protein